MSKGLTDPNQYILTYVFGQVTIVETKPDITQGFERESWPINQRMEATESRAPEWWCSAGQAVRHPRPLTAGSR